MPAVGVLITGGTGALGRELVPLIAREWPEEVFVLTRDPSSPGARAVAAEGRLALVRGDVTSGEALGLSPSDAATLRARVTHVMHCAAATSFVLPLDDVRRMNVGGTRALLDFARTCPRLEGVVCASTAYVAGRRTGLVNERDTSAAGYVNTYEQSKHEMEDVVRDAMTTLPVSVARFSTIIGHSRTGAVTGFNAIHHALRLFYQGLAPMLPGALSTTIDLIAVDYAARALLALTRSFRAGETYHLCAGASGSCTLDELLERTVAVFEQTRPAWRKRRIERPAVVDADTYELFVRSVEESGNVVLQHATRAVQAFALQLAYPKTFDTANARAALAPHGITAPRVADFYDRVVAHCVATNWGSHAASAGGAAA